MTRTERIARLRTRVSKMADCLGYPVDPGIRETVIALLLHGFPTTSSCEGHADHGWSAPWVLIEPRPPKRLRRRALYVWRTRHRQKLEWKLLRLLSTFYRSRSVPADVRLGYKYIGYGSLCLINLGREAVDILPTSARDRKRRRYRQEMNAFAAFLLARPG